MERDGESSNACHERARRAVFGFLAAAVLHETNNVLTVMAGVRQLLRAGQSLSERVGTMIDQQLARMEELVGAIRRVGPEESDPGKGPRGLVFVVDAVQRILALAGKGRGLSVERELPPDDVRPGDAEALALATLLTLLPALPPRGRPAGTRVRLRGTVSDSEVRIETELAPLDGTPPVEPETQIARDLIVFVRGRLDSRIQDGALRAMIAVPRASR
jgi:signal transduction histidine kinase